jgi:saccharopine dehydrogenase-like NADP-dependent oxidoreductase
MKKIIVLGAGMVGSAIARDLAKSFSVTSADLNKAALAVLKKKFSINTVEADLSNGKKIKEIIADADLVIGAVPGFMGFETCRAVIEAGKDLVDISFFPEDAFELDALAKKKNVTAVVDCGVAPGMDNILLGYHNKRMEVEEFTCMVGGLPFTRTLPFQYKAPFSPIDVIEEYTRPARLVEKNEIVVKPALTEPELVEFETIGTLEAFNTDGLRSLVKTMKIKNMKEKTLRYPGYRQMMETLRDAGMFSEKEIEVKGKTVRPLDVTSRILLPQWKLEQGEREFTVMRIIISGKEKGKQKTYTYDLFDEYDAVTGFSSMARTTGFTCTAAAHLVATGKYTRKGIIVPEFIGEEKKSFDFIMSYLKERNVIYKAS